MASTVAPTPAALLLDPLGRALTESRPATTPTIVVATDGGPSSTAALRLAWALAKREHEPLEVVTVVERMTSGVKGFCLDAAALEGDTVSRSGVLSAMRAQLPDLLGPKGWRLHVEFGRAAPTIARAAEELDARYVILGLGKARPVERLFGAETAARVLRYAKVPVIAVHPTATSLPRNIAVAIDFSEPSLRAARVAASLVEESGTLHLVHVAIREDSPSDEARGWQTIYDTGVAATLEQLRNELARDGITVRSHVLEGLVTEQMAIFARNEGVDILAAGSHSHLIVDRLLLGSVPAQLLRAAECSVLVAPPAVS